MIVTDIYAAREKDTGIVSSKDIVDRMADYDVDVHYIKEFDDIEEFILKGQRNILPFFHCFLCFPGGERTFSMRET